MGSPRMVCSRQVLETWSQGLTRTKWRCILLPSNCLTAVPHLLQDHKAISGIFSFTVSRWYCTRSSVYVEHLRQLASFPCTLCLAYFCALHPLWENMSCHSPIEDIVLLKLWPLCNLNTTLNASCVFFHNIVVYSFAHSACTACVSYDSSVVAAPCDLPD
jgi:hypothetical protein